MVQFVKTVIPYSDVFRLVVVELLNAADQDDFYLVKRLNPLAFLYFVAYFLHFLSADHFLNHYKVFLSFHPFFFFRLFFFWQNILHSRYTYWLFQGISSASQSPQQDRLCLVVMKSVFVKDFTFRLYFSLLALKLKISIYTWPCSLTSYWLFLELSTTHSS